MVRKPCILIHSTSQSPVPVVTGCPFPGDAVPTEGGVAEIILSDGATVPAQTRELITRTPGGITWVELSFLCPRGGEAEVRLTGKAPVERPLIATTPGGLALDNGLLKVELAGDAAMPPLRVSWKGGEGSLVPEMRADGSDLREPSAPRRSLRVTRNGPLRGRAEVHGLLSSADGRRFFRYRLAVEIWNGLNALGIDWTLSHETPGVPEMTVERAALLGEWRLGGPGERVFRQTHHTAEYIPRIVRNPDPVTILADDLGWSAHVSDPGMLLDNSVYPSYCRPAVTAVPPWLQLHGKTGAVCLTVKDFVESRPNALESSGDCLNYFMVPPGKGLNWPQGRRRQQNVLLAFSSDGRETDVDGLERLASSLFAIGRAQPAPRTLIAARCFDLDRLLPFVPGENVRMNHLLAGLCELQMPAGKWNLGDTPDWNYTLTYGAGLNQYLPLPGAPLPPKQFAIGARLYPDSVAHGVEPVWTNNEYDIIHALALEVMRTGQAEHFPTLRWAARHNIEVDFVVYSDDPRHHRASPFHSHFHNTKGAITSHFWTQGLLEYHCLTGDDDALEVALALGDKILEINHSGVSAQWKFDREIGWALLALVSLLECGFDRFREEADQLARFLQEYDRRSFSGAVKLSAGKEGRSLVRQMIDCGFGYASMVEALDRYERLTGAEGMEEWLRELLRELKSELWAKVNDGELPTVRNMIGLMMAIGFERTGDPDFLAAGELALEHHLDPVLPGSSAPSTGQVKPSAMTHRGLARLLGALEKCGRLRRFEYPALLEHRRVSG
jgi:hypothetical protein